MDPKYVLITGCSTGGIGHAIALSFQKRGYTVFATVRKAENTLKDFEDVQILDVTSPKSVATVVEYVKDKTGGKLDVLVNNAGQQFVTPALDVNIDAAKELFEVNYWGPLRMMQEFSSMLIAAKGCVVNVTSTAALLPMPIQSQYNASKAAIASLSETMRLELAPLNVRVITLMASSTKSNIDTNCPPESLPQTSRYISIKEHIKKTPQWSQMPTEKFAESVVSDVLRGVKGKIWYGEPKGIMRWVFPVLPQWLLIDDLEREGDQAHAAARMSPSDPSNSAAYQNLSASLVSIDNTLEGL